MLLPLLLMITYYSSSECFYSYSFDENASSESLFYRTPKYSYIKSKINSTNIVFNSESNDYFPTAGILYFYEFCEKLPERADEDGGPFCFLLRGSLMRMLNKSYSNSISKCNSYRGYNYFALNSDFL